MKHMRLCVLMIALCAVLFMCKTTGQGKPVTEDGLIGNWETIKGDAEEIAFSVARQGEKIYSSYLHGRLFETGTWELTDDGLVINLDSDESITYAEVTLSGDILTLRTADGEESQYKKITP